MDDKRLFSVHTSYIYIGSQREYWWKFLFSLFMYNHQCYSKKIIPFQVFGNCIKSPHIYCTHQYIVFTAKYMRTNSSLNSPPIYLHLIFEISSLRNWFLNLMFELDFLFISNWIFAGCTGSKNQVWNRQKIKFKNQFRELEISKIKCRSTGGHCSTWLFSVRKWIWRNLLKMEVVCIFTKACNCSQNYTTSTWWIWRFFCY